MLPLDALVPINGRDLTKRAPLDPSPATHVAAHPVSLAERSILKTGNWATPPSSSSGFTMVVAFFAIVVGVGSSIDASQCTAIDILCGSGSVPSQRHWRSPRMRAMNSIGLKVYIAAMPTFTGRDAGTHELWWWSSQHQSTMSAWTSPSEELVMDFGISPRCIYARPS